MKETVKQSCICKMCSYQLLSPFSMVTAVSLSIYLSGVDSDMSTNQWGGDWFSVSQYELHPDFACFIQSCYSPGLSDSFFFFFFFFPFFSIPTKHAHLSAFHVLEGYTVYLLCLQLSMQRYKGTMDDNIQPTLRRG